MSASSSLRSSTSSVNRAPFSGGVAGTTVVNLVIHLCMRLYAYLIFIYVDSAAFWLGCVRMSQRFIKDSFSYCEPCVNEWKTNHTLCMLATKCKQLVRDTAQGKIVYPTLQNIRFNHALLKAYTKTMAERGVIMTNRMSYIKPPVRIFFELMEIDCKTDAAITAIHATAYVIKQMLSAIKRKWRKWELPRATGIEVKHQYMLKVFMYDFWDVPFPSLMYRYIKNIRQRNSTYKDFQHGDLYTM